MQVRLATEGDAQTLAELGAKTFYETFRPFHSEEDMQLYISGAYDVNKILSNLHSPAHIYLLAEENEKAGGYVKLIKDVTIPALHGRLIEMEKIYVLKEELGSGMGASLMKSALEISLKEGYDQMLLGVWQENHRAVAFYKKFGFTVFNTRKFQLGKETCEDFMMSIALKDFKR